MKQNLADIKVFSLNDLIDMGLISKEDLRKYLLRLEAEKFIKDNFQGMF